MMMEIEHYVVFNRDLICYMSCTVCYLLYLLSWHARENDHFIISILSFFILNRDTCHITYIEHFYIENTFFKSLILFFFFFFFFFSPPWYQSLITCVSDHVSSLSWPYQKHDLPVWSWSLSNVWRQDEWVSYM
jgi:hypothetical protein